MKLIAAILLVAHMAVAQGWYYATAGAGGGGGQTITDDFNRANNSDLGASWTTVTSEGNLEIISNTASTINVMTDDSERYSGVTWTDNQSSEAEITVSATDAGAGLGVIVRCASAARTYYRIVINSDGEWELLKQVAGTGTALASGTTTYVAGAVLKLSAIGTTITSTYNGSQIDTRTDSSIASGSPGIALSSNITSGNIDDWVGKDGL